MEDTRYCCNVILLNWDHPHMRERLQRILSVAILLGITPALAGKTYIVQLMPEII